jgi:protein-disulfide isomerase
MQGSARRTIVPFVLLASLLLLVAVINWLGSPTPPALPAPRPDPSPRPETVEKYWTDIVAASPAGPRGSASAAFSMVEFGDFECPLCGQMRPLLEQDVADSGGRLNLYFIQRPFPAIHVYAEPAAEAAVFASKHGRFWPMYDLLYAHQDDLEPGDYGGYAEQLGMNGDAMQKAVKSYAYSSDVDRSSRLADRIGVNETPTLALRDNRAGRFVWVLSGNIDVLTQQLARADWSQTTQAARAQPVSQGGS